MAALEVAQTDPGTDQTQQATSPDTQAVMAQLRAQQAQASQGQPSQGSVQPPLPTGQATPQQVQQAVPTQQSPQEMAPGDTQRAVASENQRQLQGSPQVAQSEPTPKANRPILDPRPYASLAEHAPQFRQLIDRVADETGASPQRLAAHWAKEGGFQTQVADGKAGEQGPMQVMPATAARFDPQGHMNPHDLHDSLTVAGRFINSLDSRFGKDSPSSVAAYQGGEGSAADIAANPGQALQNHPRTMAYTQSMFPGQQVTPGHFTGPQDYDPKQLVEAASKGGPDGFLNYVAQTAQQAGTNMTDSMRAAESALVGFMAQRGDVNGMQHARDFVLQLAHAGSNQYLMQAHQALGVGDSAGAAQALAKAHAFFPDGTMGSFGVDKQGQVWGQRMDEHNPGQPLGKMFKVDQQGIQQMFNQTQDPARFLQMVQEEQKSVAANRLAESHGAYYAGLDQQRRDLAADANQTKRDIAGGNNDARIEAAQVRADGTVTAAGVRAGRQGQGPAAALSKQADKEAADTYNDITMPDAQDTERGAMAETYHDVRMGGVTGPQAKAVTAGIHSGQLQLVQGRDGRYGVMNPKDKSGQPIAIVSQALGDRLAGGRNVARSQGAIPGAGVQQGGASPVGSAAASPQAQARGVSNDLSGTVQPQQPSSAIPTS